MIVWRWRTKRDKGSGTSFLFPFIFTNARRIARVVRERDGGLPFVKALGFELHSRRIVQVSMNLTNYEQTSIARAFEAVRDEAERLNVKVRGAEIVGLVPRDAFDREAAYVPLLENFSETVILENLLP